MRLFPAFPLNPSKPSNYFSEWFSSIRNIEGGASLPDFHSLRHTVRSKFAAADIAEPMIDTLIGHEVKGGTGLRFTPTARWNASRRPLTAWSIRACHCLASSPSLSALARAHQESAAGRLRPLDSREHLFHIGSSPINGACMYLDKFIADLQLVRAQYGDLPVWVNGSSPVTVEVEDMYPTNPKPDDVPEKVVLIG